MRVNEDMDFKLLSYGFSNYSRHFYFWYFVPEPESFACEDCDACFIGFGFLKNKFMLRIFILGHEFKWSLRPKTKGEK